MDTYARKPDLLGVLEVNELFQPYETSDGWTVVLPGEEDGRRKKTGRELVAVTRVQITVPDDEALRRCVHELAESDRRLRELSGKPPYDWQKVMIKGRVVRFGVAWYDREFFEQRNEAFKSAQHANIFAKFAVTPDQLEVEHEILGERRE